MSLPKNEFAKKWDTPKVPSMSLILGERVLQCGAVCCGVLQCAAVCCSVLQ